jgi:hypothetical protein
MIFVVFNTELNRDESYPFDTNNSNDMDDFKGWQSLINDNNNLVIKVIKE